MQVVPLLIAEDLEGDLVLLELQVVLLAVLLVDMLQVMV
jgi:hypothetical protein